MHQCSRDPWGTTKVVPTMKVPRLARQGTSHPTERFSRSGIFHFVGVEVTKATRRELTWECRPRAFQQGSSKMETGYFYLTDKEVGLEIRRRGALYIALASSRRARLFFSHPPPAPPPPLPPPPTPYGARVVRNPTPLKQFTWPFFLGFLHCLLVLSEVLSRRIPRLQMLECTAPYTKR